jgi:hypothetical protein
MHGPNATDANSGVRSSRPRPAREEQHASESYPIQKRQVASAIPGQSSNGGTFAPRSCRAGHRRFADACDGSRPGISVVPVTRGLSPLLLQDAAAMSVDCIGQRRLCLESALAIPGKAARFQREHRWSKKPLSSLNSTRTGPCRRLTFAAGPALQRPIPVRRRRSEVGLPI